MKKADKLVIVLLVVLVTIDATRFYLQYAPKKVI